MAYTTTPNMLLTVPTVGSEPGPNYATDVNSSLTVIDSHDHSLNHGVQITPTGLNINSDLPFNENNATQVRSIRFNPYSTEGAFDATSADLGCLLEIGVDLYYIDGSGNLIRFTQSGSPVGATGTITGLPSGTASAHYSTGTFIFQAATNTAANIDAGSYIFRNNTAGSHGITLQPVSSLPTDYSLTLPLIPSVLSPLTIDTSGNITAQPYVNAKYNTSSQVVVVGGTVVTCTVKEFDTNNAYNTSTGTYTVPVSGVYEVGAGIVAGSIAGTSTQAILLQVWKNGSLFTTIDRFQFQLNTSLILTLNGSTLISANATDYFYVVIFNSTISTTGLDGSSDGNYVFFNKVG